MDLQNLTSIQPRTSLAKFAKNYPKVRIKVRKNMKHIGESSISKPGGMWRGNPSLDQARLQVRKRRSFSFLRHPSSCMFLFLIVIVCLLAPFSCRLRSFVIFLFQHEACRAILPTCGRSSSIRLRLCEETCTAPIWCNYCISTCRGKTVSPMDGKLCRLITLGDPKPHTRLDI